MVMTMNFYSQDRFSTVSKNECTVNIYMNIKLIYGATVASVCN